MRCAIRISDGIVTSFSEPMKARMPTALPVEDDTIVSFAKGDADPGQGWDH